MNDNRNYKFSPTSFSKRAEYPTIAQWIPRGSKVIDLGCGDGSLLALLKERGVEGEGIEITPSGVAASRRKGVKAKVGRIDASLPYEDRSFDFAICNVTLQMVMYPEVLLAEMKRIAKKQIVSFPNFAFLLNRLELLLGGRMPRTMIPGYTWYSTGHIHQLSITDFQDFCRENSLRIVDQHHIYPERLFFFPRRIFTRFPNVFASTAIFLTEAEK
jgi:methionine biosynthesis protein MetW